MSTPENPEPLPFNESAFDAFPLLETQRLVLRQVEESDEQAILNLFSDEIMVTWTGKEVFRTLPEARSWISKLQDLYANREGFAWN
jgi:ribosomal-protein-alanine N-acetyltransferase